MKIILKIFITVINFFILLIPIQTIAAPININSIVYGPPPATAPTIDVPADGLRFNDSLITVSGTCITGLTVRVFRNNIFGGSTICNAGGSYSLQINLQVGSNQLVARQYDGLNQASPDSNIVNVTYSPPPQSPSTPAAPQAVVQLQLSCDYATTKGFVDQTFKLPCQITGGVPPYAVSINWGDGTNSVVALDTAGRFMLEHTYKSAGNYLIKIQATDKPGEDAFLQIAVVITGKQDLFSKLTEPLYQCKPDIIWPLLLLLLLLLMILLTSYMIGKRQGEREELEELRRLHRLKNPPSK